MTRTVLVLDDEPDIRELLAMSLEHVGGYRVVRCASGAEALAAVAAADGERPIDGALLDVQMPGMDGPAVLAEIRLLPAGADLPVALLTASVLEPQLASLRALDVRAVMSKPFDPLTLPVEVARVFGWAS